MINISNYLLPIVGVIIIGFLVDILLPEGKTQKYIKSIFALITVLLIVTPIVAKKNDSYSHNFDNKNEINLDYDYLSQVYLNRKIHYENAIIRSLNESGFSGVEVNIIYSEVNQIFVIDEVVINLQNVVIQNNLEHIDKYELIKRVVSSLVGVEESKISIYE